MVHLRNQVRGQPLPLRWAYHKSNPQNRLNSHFSDMVRWPTWPIYRWLSRCNPDEMYLDILEECPYGDTDFLYSREMYWIEYYRDLQGSLKDTKTEFYLLNVLEGGRCGRLGKPHTEETKMKMSKAHLELSKSGWKHTAETREKMSASQRGKTFSDETRAKLSESKKGNTQAHYALHVRHHVNTGKVKPGCTHCPDLTKDSQQSRIDNVGSR